MSFLIFQGLELQDGVPDRYTIWNFREQLNSVNGFEELFAELNRELKEADLEASNGMIVDANIDEKPYNALH